MGDLIKRTEFEVPLYQRSYSWTSEAKDFYDDILTRLTSTDPYFIGPMVFLRKNAIYHVIDGQQRLITACLILAALRDACAQLHVQKKGGKEIWTEIDTDYFHHKTGIYASPRLFIKPNKIDSKIFKAIVETTDLRTKEKKITALLREKRYESWKNMWKSFKEFRTGLQTALRSYAKKKRYLLAYRLAEALDKRILAAEITVDSEQNAFTVFESLNAKGLRLAPIDLIKNYLFSKIGSETEIIENETRWESFLDQVDPNELTMIIRYYLILKEGFLRERDVFKKLRTLVKSKTSALEFIDSINKYLGYYSNIIKPMHQYWGSEELSDWLDDLHSLKFTQHIPILFALLDKYPKRIKTKDHVRRLYFTSIRRLILKRSPSEFEKRISELASHVSDGKRAQYSAVLENLSPEATSVAEALTEYVFESTKEERLAKLLLRTLESEEGEFHAIKDLTLEHIWPQSKKRKLSEESLCYRLGNLTLLTDVKNKRALAKPYTKKKKVYKSSKLKLNSNLLSKYSSWSEASINKRSREIANSIAKALAI